MITNRIGDSGSPSRPKAANSFTAQSYSKTSPEKHAISSTMHRYESLLKKKKTSSTAKLIPHHFIACARKFSHASLADLQD